ERAALFQRSDGAFQWQLTVPKLASGKVNDWEYLGLLSSPLVEENRVYLVTSRCEVLALDLNGQYFLYQDSPIEGR
ncbi:MAG: hypothetical protein HC893_11140, partial [Chloroflexaceae bacterium]|nr:hypothetical protein [Chloroflexaceae bacterium]